MSAKHITFCVSAGNRIVRSAEHIEIAKSMIADIPERGAYDVRAASSGDQTTYGHAEETSAMRTAVFSAPYLKKVTR